MKYLFNISASYWVEAESEEQARELLDNDRDKYATGWVEVDLIEEEGE